MSRQLAGAAMSPIAESSVPRCVCSDDQPCTCERYAHRLEERHHDDTRRMAAAGRKLRQAEEALLRLAQSRLTKEIAIALAAVQAAEEQL